MKNWQNINPKNIIGEEWKDIPSLKGRYQVSNKCRIRSLVYRYDLKRENPKIISQYISENGYCRCVLRDTKENNYKIIYKFVHRLIAESFLVKVDGKDRVNHIDANKQNNQPDNLEWCTDAENNIHGWNNRLFDNTFNLTDDEINDIYNSELRLFELKNKYPNTHENTIRRIRGAKAHTRITNATINKNNKVLDEKVALEIYKSDLTTMEICDKYGVNSHCIFRIKTGRNFSNITGQKNIIKWQPRYKSKEEILHIYNSKLTIKQSVKVFKMSFYTIRAIRNGELYSEITKHNK